MRLTASSKTKGHIVAINGFSEEQAVSDNVFSKNIEHILSQVKFYKVNLAPPKAFYAIYEAFPYKCVANRFK